jgi:protein SCO1/2
MARYLYGLEFPSNDLRLGLLEASEGRHITTVEKLILYCYHYDPQGGKYVLVAMRVMQVGGAAVAIALFGFLGILWAREYRRSKRGPGDGTSGISGPADDTASSSGGPKATTDDTGEGIRGDVNKVIRGDAARSLNMSDAHTAPVRGG